MHGLRELRSYALLGYGVQGLEFRMAVEAWHPDGRPQQAPGLWGLRELCGTERGVVGKPPRKERSSQGRFEEAGSKHVGV